MQVFWAVQHIIHKRDQIRTAIKKTARTSGSFFGFISWLIFILALVIHMFFRPGFELFLFIGIFGYVLQ